MLRAAVALAALAALVGPAAGASNSLMDVSADGKRLVVANADSGTVSVVDIPGRKRLAEVNVGDAAGGARRGCRGGPLALVTVYGDDALAFLDADAGKVVGTLKVDDEPYGVVVTADGKFAYVSHDYPGTVSEIDVAARKVVRTFRPMNAGVGCRGLALSADGKTLYVTEFYTAALVSLDRASGKVRERWEADEQDNLARHVELHPKRGKAYVSHTRDRVTAFDARGSVFPYLSFCDTGADDGKTKRRRTLALDTYNEPVVVTNPWESAVSPDGAKLYTVYSGTNDANVSATVDDDYTEIGRLGRLATVGRHPRAVRVSPDGREVYVYATLDHSVNVFNATLTKKLESITVATPAHTAEWRRGKELFQTALAPMGSARWDFCSSCHVDGLHDGRVWDNPEGRRKTPNLFGMAHTHPLHWSGDRDEAQDFEYTVRGKLMQGRGLAKGHDLKPRTSFTEFAEAEQTTAGLSADLDRARGVPELVPVPAQSARPPAPASSPPRRTRGRTLFQSAAVGCATCHSGALLHGQPARQAVQPPRPSGRGRRDEQVGPKYDTPTLLGAYRVNSYLARRPGENARRRVDRPQQGRQAREDQPPERGRARGVVAFLKSLPFEAPPSETPNAVPHRLKPARREGSGER